ncbi:MAG: NUDIX hydrolase [Nitrospirae bacterium]|nr:NUDIX hydrolase [Nitrospirota bacterium]
MKKPASLKQQISSGGVIFRHEGDLVEVALVSVKGGRFWCLPKGLIDKGETPEITAVREVREESGLSGKIIDKLGEITYWYYIQSDNTKCRKTVHFYLMEYTGGDISGHDLEVDAAEWFPLETALQKISFKGDRKILEKAKTALTGEGGLHEKAAG